MEFDIFRYASIFLTYLGHKKRIGAWDDSPYMFDYESRVPPFDRSAKNGFRCVLYPDPKTISEAALRSLKQIVANELPREVEPAPNPVFQVYREQFAYDKTDLDPRVEYRKESPGGWIRDRWFQAERKKEIPIISRGPDRARGPKRYGRVKRNLYDEWDPRLPRGSRMSIKKWIWSVVSLLIVSSPAHISAGPPSGQSPLADVYKAGPIRLEPDPAFGQSTEWNSLFFNLYCDLAAAPDGGLFIADSHEHKVFKFDARGNLVMSFGQKGQGPGDFNLPCDLSVLDGKYLVVGEFAESRRISLFDLDGKFNRVLSTKRSTYRPVALRDGKIAYLSSRSQRDGAAGVKMIKSVVIRGIEGPSETVITEHAFNWNGVTLRMGGALSFHPSDSGDIFIAATKDGNLLVGNSLQAFFDVYSPAGVKLSSIDLGLEPIPVTKDYKKRYKDRAVEGMRKNPRNSQGPFANALNEVNETSFDQFFSDHLPFYHEVLVDADGNILVFRKTECQGDCPILIRVYSPEGRFVCETEIQEGRFGLTVDTREKNMLFGRDGLVAVVEVKDAAEFELRVIRVSYGPSARLSAR